MENICSVCDNETPALKLRTCCNCSMDICPNCSISCSFCCKCYCIYCDDDYGKWYAPLLKKIIRIYKSGNFITEVIEYKCQECD